MPQHFLEVSAVTDIAVTGTAAMDMEATDTVAMDMEDTDMADTDTVVMVTETMDIFILKAIGVCDILDTDIPKLAEREFFVKISPEM